jgi:hypothetical protein
MMTHMAVDCHGLCLSFRCHLAHEPPRYPNSVSPLERRCLFTEQSSYSYDLIFNCIRSADLAAFKCGYNLFPDKRRSHKRLPSLHPFWQKHSSNAVTMT